VCQRAPLPILRVRLRCSRRASRRTSRPVSLPGLQPRSLLPLRRTSRPELRPASRPVLPQVNQQPQAAGPLASLVASHRASPRRFQARAPPEFP
jgi:hypothetical protein